MSIIELKDFASFNDALEKDMKSLLVIDFYATWCEPCNYIAPYIVKLAEKNPTVKFYKVNVDKNKKISTKYKITAMPTILFIKEHVVLETIVGANMLEIEKTLSYFK